jgi:hypothetical protein
MAVVLPSFAADPVQLFNGRDLTGWTMVGPGRFVIEDGMLKTEGGMGLLFYDRQRFGNQTLRVVFKTVGDRANSGVFIRLPEPPPDPWYGVHNGFEVQIESRGDDWHSTGSIYSISKVSKRTQKPAGEWNTMDIELHGPLTRISLNGEVVNEFKEGQTVPDRKMWYEPVRGPRPDYGYIGLQNHGPNETVYFREVSIITPPNALALGERNRMLSYLHATRKQLLDAVTGLTEAQWNFKPADNKWSIRDVVEHLTLSEEGIFNMATAGLKQSAPPPAQKQKDEEWVAMITSRSRPAQAPEALRPTGKWTTTDALVEEFRDRRDRNLAWVRETQDNLRGSYTKLGTVSRDVYQALLLIPAHIERHLAQINEVKADPKYPK